MHIYLSVQYTHILLGPLFIFFSQSKHHLTFDTYEKREKESKLLLLYIYLSNANFNTQHQR